MNLKIYQKLQGHESLASLCKSFQVKDEYRKTKFCHDFAILEHLNYVGDPPSSEFWEGNRIPDEFLSFLPDEIHSILRITSIRM